MICSFSRPFPSERSTCCEQATKISRRVSDNANYPPCILSNNFKKEYKKQSYVLWLHFTSFTNQNIRSISSRRVPLTSNLSFELRKENKEHLKTDIDAGPQYKWFSLPCSGHTEISHFPDLGIVNKILKVTFVIFGQNRLRASA